MARWTLTVRDGPRVTRTRFASLACALGALEQELGGLRPRVRRQEVRSPLRTFSADRVVAARAEVAGPGRLVPDVRAGVDVHADGSLEAWTGGWRRRRVEAARGVDAVEALRQALSRRGG